MWLQNLNTFVHLFFIFLKTSAQVKWITLIILLQCNVLVEGACHVASTWTSGPKVSQQNFVISCSVLLTSPVCGFNVLNNKCVWKSPLMQSPSVLSNHPWVYQRLNSNQCINKVIEDHQPVSADTFLQDSQVDQDTGSRAVPFKVLLLSLLWNWNKLKTATALTFQPDYTADQFPECRAFRKVSDF